MLSYTQEWGLNTSYTSEEDTGTHLGEWRISLGLTWLNTCIIFWAALCCWISYRVVRKRLIAQFGIRHYLVLLFCLCVLYLSDILTLKQSCRAVFPWKYLCQARTTSTLKALTTYARPGVSTSCSAQVHSTLQPCRRPPSRDTSSLERGCNRADSPRDDHDETVLDLGSESKSTSSRL